jgi:hypothetical protein
MLPRSGEGRAVRIVREADTTFAWAREARGSSTTSLLSPPCLLGRAGAWKGTAGPCCGKLGVAGYPCARWSAAEGGREAAARRRRLT